MKLNFCFLFSLFCAAGSKLRRLKSAIDANLITIPYPSEYQDVHVIASVLKSYLRDLPEPLLTFQLYDQFISASQRPTEEQRKTAILNTVCQLPKCSYDNLKYLTKFLGESRMQFNHLTSQFQTISLIPELLSQKSKANKMSPQNIAIVMAPNLLWSHETTDDDYVSKVNSTASVNTIVEALVSDWSFFFGEDFALSDFYVTMTRDELFPHNGGFPIDRDYSESNMIKSTNTPIPHPQTISNVPSSNNNNNLNQSMASISSPNYQTHSRSSSHDTGRLILETEQVGGSSDSINKRSQSNSSLSDSSPPPQSSPKQPQRRKGNKGVAPTPPDQRSKRASEYFGSINSGSHNESMQAAKERFLNLSHTPPQDELKSKSNSNRFLRSETKAQQATNASPTFKQPTQPLSMKQCSSSTENLATKPDKPPRPAMPVIDSQTLVRNAFKAKANERHSRPIALPRNSLNVARSTENLCISSIKTTSNAHSSNDDNEPVPLRDGIDHNRGDKPAIPERPTSLMKPNFRTAVFDKFETPQTNATSNDPNGSIKKTQSFRMSSTPVGAAVGSITGRSLTTLERTHIYNVDKKQVEIIDVDQQSNSNGSTDSSNGSFEGAPINGDKLQPNDNIEKVLENPNAESNIENLKPNPNESNDSSHLLNISTNSNAMSTSTISNSGNGPVPQSPRSFEMKNIKRPQVPAPPPPNVQSSVGAAAEHTTIENRKADPARTADSTKL